MKLTLAIVLSLFTASAFAAETRQFKTDSFDRLDVGGNFTIEVKRADKQSVAITAESKVFDYIDVSVEGSELRIQKKDDGFFNSCPSSCEAKVVITAPVMDEIELSGAVELTATDLVGDRLDLDLSGAVQATLSGAVDTLMIDASGASEVRAFELKAKNVEVDASGAAEIQVHSTAALEVDGSGATDVKYRGKPGKVASNISGAGRVEAVGM